MYAKETMEPAKYSAWMEINLEELKAYIGFCILMGLVPLPELSDYWTSDPYFHYASGKNLQAPFHGDHKISPLHKQ